MTAPVEPAEKKPRAAAENDRRSALLHHGGDGVVRHFDNFRRDERTSAIMSIAKRRHDLIGPRNEHLQLGVGRKRCLYAVKNDPRLFVSTHGVNTNANPAHGVPPIAKRPTP